MTWDLYNGASAPVSDSAASLALALVASDAPHFSKKRNNRSRAITQFVSPIAPLWLSGDKNFTVTQRNKCLTYFNVRAVSTSTSPHSCDACTGNSNNTSFPVSRRYTEENESSLYSSDVESFGSKNLCRVPKICMS